MNSYPGIFHCVIFIAGIGIKGESLIFTSYDLNGFVTEYVIELLLFFIIAAGSLMLLCGT